MIIWQIVHILQMKIIIILASFLLITTHSADTFYDIPKILWTFWDTGYDSARLFTKMCINNMGHYSSISGWQFKFLSSQNYTDYISKESLERLNRMYQTSKHTIGRQHWADLMRLFLVYQNGGMWVDTNTFFLGNFSWIQNIANQKWVINRISEKPEMISFSLSSVMGGNKSVLYDKQLKKDVYLFPGMEIWSFISKPKSKFLTDVLNRLQYSLGVKRQILDEQTTKQQILFGREKDPYYITSNYVFQTILQKKQHQLESSQKSSSKYAVQYYQIWNIPAENTIYGIFSAQNWFTFNVIGGLFSESLQNTMNRYNIPPYFIKFNGGNYPHINNALVHHQFAGCLGIDVKIKPGSIFDEFMMKHNQNVPEIMHIKQLYQLGYMNGDCEHYGSMVYALIDKIKGFFWGTIFIFVAVNMLLMIAVKRRIVQNNKK